MNKQMKGPLIRILLIVAAVIAAYCLWCHFLSDDVIWKKITVNGIPLQGMTKEEAVTALTEDFEKNYEDTSITIHLNGKSYPLSIYPVLTLDARSLVNSVYELGHGPWYTRGIDRIELMNNKTKDEITLMPVAKSEDDLEKLLKNSDIQNGSTTKQTTLRLTDTELIIKKGTTGMAPDITALKKEILNAIVTENYSADIECPTVETAPDDVDMDAYYKEVHTDAQDASLGENNKIIPAVTGISFNAKAAARKLARAKEGETIRIPLKLTEPDVSTEDIESLPYLNLLGSYTTYGGGTKDRITNLKLAVAACDQVELQPGEIFSYNDTLGPRTAERGYKDATVIVNGKHALGIGGGICQISTTLFMACLESDLSIIERHNHAARIDYAEDGLDAAVVWGSQDFKFQNNTEYPIKLTASYDEKEEAVTVEIYGTKTDENTVEITTEPSGPNSCKTYRSVYDKDGNLLRSEEVGYSQYKE